MSVEFFFLYTHIMFPNSVWGYQVIAQWVSTVTDDVKSFIQPSIFHVTQIW